MRNIGANFVELTRFQYLEKSDQRQGKDEPSLEMSVDKDKEVIALVEPAEMQMRDVSLVEAIEKRRSVRRYDGKSYSLEDLSYLLWLTQGVQSLLNNKVTLRTVPSAGARHAFDTFLLINNVDSVKPGIYRYIATEHKLVEFDTDKNWAAQVEEACLGQSFVREAPVTFIWVADVYRMNWRYGERGYRYLYLDAGHVCQNLYLAATSLGGGACAIGAFDDEKMNEIIGLDGEKHFVIYMAAAGYKKFNQE